MGLPGAPKIKFRKGDDTKKLKNAPRAFDDDSDEPKKPEVRTKYDRMFERRNQDVLSSHYSKTIADDGTGVQAQHADADEDDDFLSVKRVVPVDAQSSSDEEDEAPAGSELKIISGIGKEALVIDSKRREKLLKSKKKLLKYKEKGVKLVYDDDGVAHPVYELEGEADFEKRGPAAAQRAKFLAEEAERVREADIDDKQLAKQKKREKKEKRKTREAAENGPDDEATPALVDTGRDEDPLALLASLPLPEAEEDYRPAKRPKKWFEDDSGDEKSRRKGRVIEAEDEPETLEDLEALAAGLLS
jgi:ATP-dependent RNA helicase DDX10/DBP4